MGQSNSHGGSVKFQILSDVHIEFPKVREKLPKNPLTPRAPYLINKYLALLGDIGYPVKAEYEAFLHEAADKFQKVFVIAGNHEYYKAEYFTTKKRIQEICDKKANLIFMDKRSELVDGIRVLGTTLWSSIPPEHSATVAKTIADYKQVWVQPEGADESKLLTVELSNSWFNDELNWLKDQIALAKHNDERVVIFTHHAPHVKGTSNPRFDGSPNSCAFSTNLESIMGDPIALWCFGHTHYSSDQAINGTRVVSNQLGYVTMGEKSGYKDSMVVEVPLIPA